MNDMQDVRLELERARLIEELRSSGVAGEQVMDAMHQVPRDRYVEPVFMEHAWANRPLPITSGQTISQPYIVAMMTEAALNGRERLANALEVGTGSGYQAAVLARVAERVYSIERIEALHNKARKALAEDGVRNVTLRLGDGHEGWPEHAPYDGILVTAAADAVPPALIEQLAPGGRLVAPVSAGEYGQKLVVVERTAEGPIWQTIEYVRFVPLLEGIEREA